MVFLLRVSWHMGAISIICLVSRQVDGEMGVVVGRYFSQKPSIQRHGWSHKSTRKCTLGAIII